MKIKDARLEKVCGVTSILPKNLIPEFAFSGKSNVGKSSLVNTLVQRKALARTSQEPGKTATINFYRIDDAFYFVDLPGYGYAKASKTEVAKWGEMIEKYLAGSEMLRSVFLLLDYRRVPSENDLLMLTYIRHHQLKPVVILTKADKLSKNERAKNLAVIRKKLQLTSEPVFPFSSVTKEGRTEILDWIEKELCYGEVAETEEPEKIGEERSGGENTGTKSGTE